MQKKQVQKSSYYLWAGAGSGQEGTEDPGGHPPAPFLSPSQGCGSELFQQGVATQDCYIIRRLRAKRKYKALCSKVIKNFNTLAAEHEVNQMQGFPECQGPRLTAELCSSVATAGMHSLLVAKKFAGRYGLAWICGSRLLWPEGVDWPGPRCCAEMGWWSGESVA